MATHLVDALNPEIVPQSEPLTDEQVKNSAGGYVWEVDEWTHLRRFLILGSQDGSYYISERDLTKDGLNTIKACLKLDGQRLVDTILEVSDGGLAPKNDYALFALAVVVAEGDDATKRYALESLNKVARIGTHLFQFAEFLKALGSLTGRAKRRAFAKWYTDRDVSQAAYQAVKYRQRNGWTHRDILRVAHPGSISDVSAEHAQLFSWIAGTGEAPIGLDIVSGFEAIQSAKTANAAAELIREYRLPREAVPTEFLTKPEIWQALLDVDMPMTAMIRNLANMTRAGVLTSTSDATQTVIEKLTNEEAIRRSRIHPMNILFGLKTYASGRGFRGTNRWTPIQTIVDALSDSFYVAFGNVEPTGKRILIALDVSGSMSMPIFNTNVMCSEATAAMSLVTANVEKRYEIMGFADGIRNLGVTPKDRLDTAVRKVAGLTFGGTDCSLPMQYALKNKLEFDAFCIYTDNETWYGNIHPAVALQKYRDKMGIDARLVVTGMVANKFSIADKDDPGMLDVVGFDTSTPNVISNFIAGRI